MLPSLPFFGRTLQGKHLFYGAFTGSERGVLGEPTSLWVVAAPFSEPQTGGSDDKEWLVQLDAEGGRELGRVQVRWACRALPGWCSSFRASFNSGPGLRPCSWGMTWAARGCKGTLSFWRPLSGCPLPAWSPSTPARLRLQHGLPAAALQVHARRCAAPGPCIRSQHRGGQSPGAGLSIDGCGERRRRTSSNVLTWGSDRVVSSAGADQHLCAAGVNWQHLNARLSTKQTECGTSKRRLRRVACCRPGATTWCHDRNRPVPAPYPLPWAAARSAAVLSRGAREHAGTHPGRQAVGPAA